MLFRSGETGPTGETGSTGTIWNWYAEFESITSTLRGDYLTLDNILNVGDLTTLSSDAQTITLTAGYVYLINYIVRGKPAAAGDYIEILPYINNLSQLWYSGVNSSTNSTMAGICSVSGGFIIQAADTTTLKFQLMTDSTTVPVSITGDISIIPFAKV